MTSSMLKNNAFSVFSRIQNNFRKDFPISSMGNDWIRHSVLQIMGHLIKN